MRQYAKIPKNTSAGNSADGKVSAESSAAPAQRGPAPESGIGVAETGIGIGGRSRFCAIFAATKHTNKMAKRVLILSSSPRRGGNSDRLCDEFRRGAEEAGHQVEKIFLRDFTIHYCTGCGVCSREGRPCPQQDDAARIVDLMVRADVIVMASPVYFYTMSAQMKTLIDRSCARYTEISGKEFYLLLTAAEPDRQLMLRTVDTFQGFFDCLEEARLRRSILCSGVWNVGEVEGHAALQEAYEAGRNC